MSTEPLAPYAYPCNMCHKVLVQAWLEIDEHMVVCHECEELHFRPLKFTPEELEQRYQEESFDQQLLSAFALTSQEIGSVQDTNWTSESHEQAYRRRYCGFFEKVGES